MPLAVLGLLAACGEEPDFDTRYAERSREIRASATGMQQDLSNQLAAAREAERARMEAAGNAP